MLPFPLLLATALAAEERLASPADPPCGPMGADHDRPSANESVNPGLSKAVGNKFKVNCELCSDGNISILRGVRVTLFRDNHIALYGMSLAESSTRGPIVMYAVKPGTVHSVFNLTSSMRDHVIEAVRWRRFMLGAELRLSNRYVNPRLMLAVLHYEAELYPADLTRLRTRDIFSDHGLSTGRAGTAARTVFAAIPGLDTNFLGHWHLHAEAFVVYPLAKITYGTFFGASINF